MARNERQTVSGAVLKAARVMTGMRQSDLARAADLHPKTIANWERRGSRGHWNEVGLCRIVDALRSRGVEVMRGEGEGVRRIGDGVG